MTARMCIMRGGVMCIRARRGKRQDGGTQRRSGRGYRRVVYISDTVRGSCGARYKHSPGAGECVGEDVGEDALGALFMGSSSGVGAGTLAPCAASAASHLFTSALLSHTNCQREVGTALSAVAGVPASSAAWVLVLTAQSTPALPLPLLELLMGTVGVGDTPQLFAAAAGGDAARKLLPSLPLVALVLGGVVLRLPL